MKKTFSTGVLSSTSDKLLVAAQSTLTVLAVMFVAYRAGTPVRYFLFELSVWALVVSITYVIARRYIFSVLLVTLFFELINYSSFTKQTSNGQKLYWQDAQVLLEDTDFIFHYIGWTGLIFFALFIFLLVLIYQFERIGFFKRAQKYLLFFVVAAALAVCFNFLKTGKYVWNYADRVGFRNITTFVGSAFYPMALQMPAKSQEGATCCATVHFPDIELTHSGGEQPHVVSVLLESEFDIQALQGIRTAFQWADFSPVPLHVYAKGGGTWIQEYAFLHGVRPSLYGDGHRLINRVGPGLLEGRMAPALTAAGYEAISVLPYERGFYGSLIFHRSLGMDHIVDCQDMQSCDFVWGQRDELVFEELLSRLQKAAKPQFLFALTMNQHSPHHGFPHRPGRVECLPAIHPDVCHQTAEFVYRSEILKSQITRFLDRLKTIHKNTLVLFWGDHIPGFMGHLSAEHFRDQADFRTVAFLYSTASERFLDIPDLLKVSQENFVLNSEDLDMVLLRAAGFNSKYLHEKLMRYQKTSTPSNGLPS